MRQLYSYVGSPEIARVTQMHLYRVKVNSAADVRYWIDNSVRELDTTGSVTVTFIIDAE